MTDGYEALTAEIDRIVDCPYPTQLKSLRDILYTKCTEADVHRWALAKPCQIASLAGRILDGLRQWPYVLDILTKLTGIVKIRDAFLSQEPTLLHDLISEAAKAGDAGPRYVDVAVSMLSHPLPNICPLPSETQSLFIRLFDHAANQPTVANIKPVYQMLQGTSTLLLGLLSSNALLRFEEHLFNILRNNKGDNQSLSLYCLSIMKIMASASEEVMAFSDCSYDTQELLASTEVTSSRWKPDAIQQFFTESKAQKTMQLIVLRAMWACTLTTGENLDEKLESLLLANEIIDAVPAQLRESWRKANALVARKLEEKALASSLEFDLRFQALIFLVPLHSGSMRPTLVSDALRHLLLKPETFKLALSNSASRDMQCLVTSDFLEQNDITALIQNLVDFAVSADGQELLESSNHLVDLLQCMSSALSHSESIVEGVMLALDVLSCGQKLQHLSKLINTSRLVVNATMGGETCPQAVQVARRRLVHELCKVALTAALSSPHPTYSLSQNTTSLLLDLHASSSSISIACSHSQRKGLPSHRILPLVEVESTPGDADLDWRSALRAQLTTRAQSEEEHLTAFFTRACAQLEARCKDVERPLRQERERLSTLQQRYDELSEAYASLETHKIDVDTRIEATSEENDRLREDLEAAQQEAANLEQVRLPELVKDARLARSETEVTRGELIKQEERFELEQQTVAAMKDERLEDLQINLSRAEKEVHDKMIEVARLVQELEEIRPKLDAAQKEIKENATARAEQEATADQLRNERETLATSKDQLETQLSDVQKQRSEEQAENEATIKRLRQQAAQSLVSANNTNEEKLTELTRQHDENMEGVRKLLSEAQQESRQAVKQRASEKGSHQLSLTDKQKRIERLKRTCEEKDKQIAEANAMRSNLMAAMGLGGHTAQTTLPHRPSRSSAVHTQPQELESQDEPSPPTPFSGDDGDAHGPQIGASFASNASSGESRSGPTPKRARPRKPNKEPSPAKPRFSASTMSRALRSSNAGRSTVKRQPLLSVSANPSQRTSIITKTPSKGMGKELDGLDESTVEGSELFAGTPGRSVVGLSAMLDEESQDTRF